MSANNATYLLRVDWTYTSARLGALATAFKTVTKFFVFQGDVDQWGELTRKGKLTKQAMWALLMTSNLSTDDSFDDARTCAEKLELVNQTEYGYIELVVTHKTK